MHAALAVVPPSAEAQATLKKAFTAAQAGLSSADGLLSASISNWESTGQPADETASLYKTRGGLRFEEGKLEFNPTYKYHADGHECVMRSVLCAWGST